MAKFHSVQPAQLELSRRRLLGIGAGIGAVFGTSALLGACGSDEAPSSSASDAPVMAGEAAISGLSSIVTAAPFVIAGQKFYDDAAFDLANVHISGGTDTVRAILGKSPVGSSATISSIIAYQAGAKDLRIIGGGFNAPSVVFVGKRDSEIDRTKDLRGKKIGIAGTGSPVEFFAKLAISQAGLELDQDVEVVSVGDYASVWPSVKEGLVDLGALVPPQSAAATMQDGGSVVINSADLMPQWADVTIATTADAIDKYGDSILAWFRSVEKALELIKTDINEAAEIWGNSLDLPNEVAVAALESVPTAAWELKIDEGYLENPAEAAVELGLSKVKDIDGLLDTSILERL